jgi:hypothetical protein
VACGSAAVRDWELRLMSTPVFPTWTDGKVKETLLLAKLDPGTSVICALA